MSDVKPLEVDKFCWRCNADHFEFQTTDDLENLEEIVGQTRAMEAVEFGMGMRHDGYNLFVLGPPGVGKRTIVERFLGQRSSSEPTPPDWCYVQNFQNSDKPNALMLPAGRGAKLHSDMENLVEDLGSAISAAIEVEEHQNRIEEIEREAKQRHDQAFQELSERARSQGIHLVRTPGGFALAPIRDGEVLSPEDFEKLSEEERKDVEAKVASLQEELKELVEILPQWRNEARSKIKDLNREATSFAIKHLMAQIKKRYEDLPEVLEYLNSVEIDVTDNADAFHSDEDEVRAMFGLGESSQESFSRYQVNLFVDNGETNGAPVINEDHPNYHNLLGRVEHKSHMGTLFTDFTLIKPGALHRANHGYLVIDALRMLQQPYAWEGLKRALMSRSARIESLAESLSLVSTVSLEPETIPLDVKVILLGDRFLYYLMYEHDHDFPELFKVAADFEDEIDRNAENCQVYAARLIATLIRRHKNRPFDASAVARVIEQGARLADDSEKLTTHVRPMADLLREADYWASDANSDIVSATHVEKAIDKQIYRADRLREKLQEEIQRGTFLIDTQGERIGQVNGLSVLDLGNFRFGRPSRISANTRLGKGEVVDIEREVELGGSIHSKGVLILSSFLAARFAKNHPLSLSASLVFEQSYGKVDGDSASVAELCALLSSLSEAPIKQSFAVTGSVNQHGQVQAIGGVNEKIEGFFEVCRAKGLNGEQGVLIPASNVKHLMLRRHVVEAAAEGQFQAYPIETIDEAVSILTGVAAGERDECGQYSEGSINQRVEARLLEMFELRKEFGSEGKKEQPNE